MMTLILGDIHGNWKLADKLISRALAKYNIDAIYQVGDFGIGFKNFHGDVYNWNYQFDIPIRFCDGNHDNHDLLTQPDCVYHDVNNKIQHLPRGSEFKIEGLNGMAMGGAASIDKEYRIEGLSWWRGELITYADISHALTTQSNIDIILSHEQPQSFPNHDDFKFDHVESKGQRQLLEQLRINLKPKVWIFGHYHIPNKGIYEDCYWYCVPDVTTGIALLIDQNKIDWIKMF